jgi:hypothetical protein
MKRTFTEIEQDILENLVLTHGVLNDSEEFDRLKAKLRSSDINFNDRVAIVAGAFDATLMNIGGRPVLWLQTEDSVRGPSADAMEKQLEIRFGIPVVLSTLRIGKVASRL